ncbi:PREDICTED: glutamic acid-rich protein-like [Ipomoea nil]|uniref:glutamic acid-rich protein-like n=1 Tax=Ipomoea nil TaxID=35883 RepID=UPI00090185A2|nr:PREDICTED: glutamic acid-rich protein-like [Ipomoea nil]
MLHAFLGGYKVDWSQVIFTHLRHTIIHGRSSPGDNTKKSSGHSSPGDISKKMGFGFLVSHLLSMKKVPLQAGVSPGQKVCHMKSKPAGYDKQKALELDLPLDSLKKSRKSKRSKGSDDEMPKAKRSRKDKSFSVLETKEQSMAQPEALPKAADTAQPVTETKALSPPLAEQEVVTKEVSQNTPQMSSTEPVIIDDSTKEEEAPHSTPVKTSKNHPRPTIAKANEIMAKLTPPPESILPSTLKKKLASSQGEEMKKKKSKKRKKRSKSTERTKKSPLPQEPIQAEQLNTSLTQEPATTKKEAQGALVLYDHLSLPQEPGMPEETREVIADQNSTLEETSLPQEPTRTEQMALILTQEPVRVEDEEAAQQISGHLSLPQEPGKPAETREVTPPIESHPNEAQPEPEVLPETTIPGSSQAIVTVPEAAPIPPSKDQLLRESIENDFNRVMQWQKWRTSPLHTFLETFEVMKDEEEFALEWIGTKDVYEALRLETIRRVYSYKVTHRTLGNEKAPICIELNKPPLDPAFVEEMKELRYALLQSKIKTEREQTHQNNLACNVSGLKDEEGRDIDPEDEDNDKNSNSGEHAAEDKDTDEDPENQEDDEADDDKSDDAQDDSHRDDGDDDDNDEGKDDNHNHDDDSDDGDDDDDGNSDYDNESPIIGNTEDLP